MKDFIVNLIASVIFLLAGFWVFIHLAYCAPKHNKPQIDDPFESVHAICKEDDAGGLCFCCSSYGGEGCDKTNYWYGTYWQMTCDASLQMNFRIILKGQKQ